MQLRVLETSKDNEAPWFAEGLKFTCSQCGNCCSGGPGYVFISRAEIGKVSEYLGIPAREVIGKYCRKIGRQIALKEVRHPRHGGYDCIFIKEVAAEIPTGNEQVVHSKRICSIYPVRPLQCRTWPFWEGNLSSPKAWKQASRTCLGMDRGEAFDRKRIEYLRDTKEWPEMPPTSERTELLSGSGDSEDKKQKRNIRG